MVPNNCKLVWLKTLLTSDVCLPSKQSVQSIMGENAVCRHSGDHKGYLRSEDITFDELKKGGMAQRSHIYHENHFTWLAGG